jgi:rod shape-determining protein MreD
MPWIIIISITLCISLIQTILLPHISIRGIHPDLFVIFLVYHYLNSDSKQTFHASLVIGLTKDIFSVGPFGLTTVIFVILGYLISMIKDTIYRKHLLTQIMVTLTISIIYNLFYLFISSALLTSTNLLAMVWKCPIIAVYNSIIAIPVFLLLNRLYSSLRLSILDRRLNRR